MNVTFSEQDISEEELQTALRSKWWMLSFPTQLEKRYQAHILSREIKIYRAKTLLTSLLCVVFGFFIYTSLPKTSQMIWLQMYSVALLLMLVSRVLSFFRRFDRWFYWYVTAACIAAVAASVAIDHIVPLGAGAALSYVAMTYVVFIVYCFIGLRIRFALFAGWFGGAIGIALTYALGSHVNWQILHGTYTAASLIGVIMACLLDRQSRINFLQAMSLSYLSLHDTLTNLPNRALFEDRITSTLNIAQREDRRFVLMFMDLDGFKEVNDAYGHHIGDLLLNEVAQRVQKRIRTQDTFARLGGDEFVLLISNNESEGVAILADKLLGILREPFYIENHALRITGSIGIAQYPENGNTQHDLLTNADAAMYHAKATGRDTYCFFDSSMDAHAHEHMELVQDLRMALERHELVVY
jgi:diguanylate cyclase (GGDEF)-like protein